MSIAVSRPSLRHAGAMPDDRRMPLGRRQHVLDAVVDHLHRPVRPCSASSAAWPAIIDGYSSLPPKPPPVSVWTTRTLLGRQAEQHHQRLVHVVRALQRAVDRDAAVLRARRSRRWSRCRAAPGGRCGTRPRRRGRPRRSRGRGRPSRSRSSLNVVRRRCGIEDRAPRLGSRSRPSRRAAASRGPRARAAGSARRRGGPRARRGTAGPPRSARRRSGPGCRGSRRR